MHRSLDLLSNIGNETRYSVWWQISDKYPEMTRKCEILMEILCHSSNLLADDVKSRNQPRVNKMCVLCDRYEVEDAIHLILQCPFFHQERVQMFNDISNVDRCIDNAIRDTGKDILHIILGYPIDGISEELLERIRMIVLNSVSLMYIRNTSEKRGVG